MRCEMLGRSIVFSPKLKPQVALVCRIHGTLEARKTERTFNHLHNSAAERPFLKDKANNGNDGTIGRVSAIAVSSRHRVKAWPLQQGMHASTNKKDVF
jgi:hypothetical protein